MPFIATRLCSSGGCETNSNMLLQEYAARRLRMAFAYKVLTLPFAAPGGGCFLEVCLNVSTQHVLLVN